MKLIVGLGNPGDKYEKTRHNLGFLALEQFLKDFEPLSKTVWEKSTKFKADIAHIEWQPISGKLEKVVLVKPATYMNNSGMAVSLLSKFYKIIPDDIFVIHDELDLPIGSMKIRFGGASAGHNGVGSVMESLGTDKFWRMRLGIGEEKVIEKMAKHKIKNTEDFVLSNFSGKERSKLKHLLKNASEALQEILEKGTDSAMNRFNTR